jgi:hypothetical protein
MLAHNIEAGMERAKRAAEVQAAKELKAAEDTTKEQLAYAILHTDYTDGEAVDGMLESVKQAPFPELALHAHDQIQMRRARVVEEQHKGAAQLQKEQADGAYRQLYRSISTGMHADGNGVLVHYSPAERVAMIDQAFAMPGGLQLSDRNALLAEVKRDSDKRMQDMTSAVMSKVIPDASKYFATTDGGTAFRIDDSGRVAIGQDAKKKTPFDPATKLFHRSYDSGKKMIGGVEFSKVPAKFASSAVAAPAEEEVTLADIQDSLRVVKERMEVDPKMTVDAGVELFRDLARPSLDKLSKNRIQVALREQSWLTEVMRQNLERRRMAVPSSK